MAWLYVAIILGSFIVLYTLSWDSVAIFASSVAQNQQVATDVKNPVNASSSSPDDFGSPAFNSMNLVVPESEASSLNYEKDLVSLEILPLDVTLKVGQSWNFRALAVYSDKSVEDISSFASWQVSPDSSVIESNGLFRAEEPGDYWITASYGDQASKKAKLKVLPATEASERGDTVRQSAQARAVLPKANNKITLRFGYPVDNYRTTLKFGKPNPYYGNKIHLGEDVPLKEGTEIHAIADGVIIYYGAAEGYGELVAVVEHNLDRDVKVGNKTLRRFAAIYGHLRKCPARVKSGNLKGKLTGKSVECSVGKRINKGDVIGYVNDPPYNGMGESHLHMGVENTGGWG